MTIEQKASDLISREAAIALLAKFALWRCRALGWHKAPVRASEQGINLLGECPRCGAHVCQDSQGNWFAMPKRPQP